MKLKKGQRLLYSKREINGMFNTLQHDIEQLTHTKNNLEYNLQSIKEDLILLKYAITGEPKC